MGCTHPFQCAVRLPFVFGREDAQPPGVGVAARRSKVKAGGQLHAAAVRCHQGKLLGPLGAGIVGKVFFVQQHRAAHGVQLARQRAQQCGFARAVGPDEGQNLAGLHPQRNAGEKRRFAVADGKVICRAEKGLVHRAPS